MPDVFDELEPFTILRCVVGSRAFGLDDTDSDTDRRGVFVPPASRHWSLAGVPEQIERVVPPQATTGARRAETVETCYWEVEKLLRLALRANPNVLECLYTPLVEETTPLGDELLALRDRFLSRLVHETFDAYAMSQFKKLEADVRLRGTCRWKHAMHLIRLLLSGIRTLQEGVVPVRVEGEHRDRLLSIRRGEVPFAEVDAFRRELHARFDAALRTTSLPERPDEAAVNAFLLKARRAMVDR